MLLINYKSDAYKAKHIFPIFLEVRTKSMMSWYKKLFKICDTTKNSECGAYEGDVYSNKCVYEGNISKLFTADFFISYVLYSYYAELQINLEDIGRP